jgi:hypothetical protein
MYSLTFVTFSGMTIPLGDDMDKEDVACEVKRRNTHARRRGLDVMKTENNTWEHTDDEAVMVGDDQGYLMVSRTATKRGRRW